jgi:secreted trypsin-like serine protease
MTTTSLVSLHLLEYILDSMKKHFVILSLFLCAGCSLKVHDGALTSTQDNSSIVGGQIVENEIFAKHVVAIHNEDLGYWCTGTLISKDTVLTAAHCVDIATEDSYTIHFSKTPRSFETVTRPASSMLANTGYNPAAYDDRKDIGLIRFKGDMPEGFEPMPMATKDDLRAMGSDFYAAGYGTVTARTDIPRDSGVLRYTTQKIKGDHLSTHQSQFLVDQTNGHGVCYGDSGGPAFIKINGRRILVGVASAVYSTNDIDRRAPGYDVCRYSAIYTSVYYYMDWIKKTSAALH